MRRKSQKRTAYCIRIINKLGGVATSADVPMFVHGVTFVDDVLDNSPKSYRISLSPVTHSVFYARTDEQVVRQPLRLHVKMV